MDRAIRPGPGPDPVERGARCQSAGIVRARPGVPRSSPVRALRVSPVQPRAVDADGRGDPGTARDTVPGAQRPPRGVPRLGPVRVEPVTRTREGSPPPRDIEDLRWLIDVLWGRSGVRARVVQGDRERDGSATSWSGGPSPDHPRFLLPIERRPGAASVT